MTPSEVQAAVELAREARAFAPVAFRDGDGWERAKFLRSNCGPYVLKLAENAGALATAVEKLAEENERLRQFCRWVGNDSKKLHSSDAGTAARRLLVDLGEPR